MTKATAIVCGGGAWSVVWCSVVLMLAPTDSTARARFLRQGSGRYGSGGRLYPLR